ncbi:MAG: hypothetical protein SP1CHLAM54_10770 [Chlamydiia bacterium]|nr:hypothetical protein [Chlamydiia bacterium]MCH9615982.1 hypothetical protein [Chlamydiia bacterium]
MPLAPNASAPNSTDNTSLVSLEARLHKLREDTVAPSPTSTDSSTTLSPNSVPSSSEFVDSPSTRPDLLELRLRALQGGSAPVARDSIEVLEGRLEALKDIPTPPPEIAAEIKERRLANLLSTNEQIYSEDPEHEARIAPYLHPVPRT